MEGSLNPSDGLRKPLGYTAHDGNLLLQPAWEQTKDYTTVEEIIEDSSKHSEVEIIAK